MPISDSVIGEFRPGLLANEAFLWRLGDVLQLCSCTGITPSPVLFVIAHNVLFSSMPIIIFNYKHFVCPVNRNIARIYLISIPISKPVEFSLHQCDGNEAQTEYRQNKVNGSIILSACPFNFVSHLIHPYK